MLTLKNRSFALLLIVSLSPGVVANAATNLVRIREIGTKFVFDPTNLTINPGDSVKWTNVVANQHDTTHNTNNVIPAKRLWASPNLSSTNIVDKSYTFTFTNAGCFPYYCFRHVVALGTNPEQTGTISVVSINMSLVQALPDGNFRFRISGGCRGQSCIIDAAETLPNWAPIATNNFPNTTCPACPVIEFTNNATLFNRRFYRSRMGP